MYKVALGHANIFLVDELGACCCEGFVFIIWTCCCCATNHFDDAWMDLLNLILPWFFLTELTENLVATKVVGFNGFYILSWDCCGELSKDWCIIDWIHVFLGSYSLVYCWIVSQFSGLSCNADLMSRVAEKDDFPVVWHDRISHFHDWATLKTAEPGIKVISMIYCVSSHAFDDSSLNQIFVLLPLWGGSVHMDRLCLRWELHSWELVWGWRSRILQIQWVQYLLELECWLHLALFCNPKVLGLWVQWCCSLQALSLNRWICLRLGNPLRSFKQPYCQARF